ncbi:hypothetical protein TL16_g10718, partial [Triparma laevis f. inornata]
AVMQTTHGVFHLELDSDIVPLTCLNFIELIKAKKYDGNIFHRLIKGFMAQTG